MSYLSVRCLPETPWIEQHLLVIYYVIRHIISSFILHRLIITIYWLKVINFLISELAMPDLREFGMVKNTIASNGLELGSREEVADTPAAHTATPMVWEG